MDSAILNRQISCQDRNDPCPWETMCVRLLAWGHSFLFCIFIPPKRPKGFEDTLFSVGKEGRKNEREEQQEYEEYLQKQAGREALENSL